MNQKVEYIKNKLNNQFREGCENMLKLCVQHILVPEINTSTFELCREISISLIDYLYEEGKKQDD